MRPRPQYHNYPDVRSFNAAVARWELDHRTETIAKYRIEYDDFNRATAIHHQDARNLVCDTRRAALEYMLASHTDAPVDYFSDDDQDYEHAALDQVIWCTSLLVDDEYFEEKPFCDEVLRAINADLDEEDYMMFRLGYADHGTPISTLNMSNHEED